MTKSGAPSHMSPSLREYLRRHPDPITPEEYRAHLDALWRMKQQWGSQK